METSNSWKLGDLDVAAFSYAPVPLTIESKIVGDDDSLTEVRAPGHRFVACFVISVDAGTSFVFL
jgi:hypothetical protein